MAVRAAQPEDAQRVAQVYIDSWHDTYPALLPSQLLRAMTPRGQTSRWRAAIQACGREHVLVADSPQHGVVGMTSFGPAQDREIGFDGEIYTLYVAPDFCGQGVGKQMLAAAFGALRDAHFVSCVIWAHAHNPARFFYEAMGGRAIGQRARRLMGTVVPETAFGWRRLDLKGGNAAARISRP